LLAHIFWDNLLKLQDELNVYVEEFFHFCCYYMRFLRPVTFANDSIKWLDFLIVIMQVFASMKANMPEEENKDAESNDADSGSFLLDDNLR